MKPTLKILYEPDFLDPKRVDEHFLEEMEEMSQHFEVGIFGKRMGSKKRIINRCWMKNRSEYSEMMRIIRKSKSIPITNGTNYINTHHMNRWVYDLAAFTIPSVPILSDQRLDVMTTLPYEQCFVKGLVKSIGQTEPIETVDELHTLLEQDRKMYNNSADGLVIRQWTPLVDEKRYFVFGCRDARTVLHQPKGSSHVFAQLDAEAIHLMEAVFAHIDSAFFTVDTARHASTGELLIVELGDGQVSSLKENTLEVLIEGFKHV